MIKPFSALAILGAASANEAYTFKYMQYLSKQNKSYSSLEEFNMRLQNFIEIDQFVEEWNSNTENKSTVGHNFLSDWTQAEKDIISGKAAQNAANRVDDREVKQTIKILSSEEQNASYPDNWNWNDGYHVRPVLSQGSCGSSYAFTAVAAVQSLISINYRK
jgi:C1A family cysteine protease